MKKILLSVLFSLAVAVCRADGPYHFIKEIPIGGDGGWDYCSVDPAGQRLYVSHGTEVVVIDLAKENGSSFSTHKIPLKIIRDYLYQSIACETIIIGIQPESLEFGQVCSAKIQESVLAVVKEMKVILKPYLQAKSIQHRALHI